MKRMQNMSENDMQRMASNMQNGNFSGMGMSQHKGKGKGKGNFRF